MPVYPRLGTREASNPETSDKNTDKKTPQKPAVFSQTTRKRSAEQDWKLLDNNHAFQPSGMGKTVTPGLPCQRRMSRGH